MKRKFLPAIPAIGIGLLLLATGGCLKDRVTETYQIQVPVYATLTQARSSIKNAGASPIQSAGKILLYKNYIFLNDPGLGVHVVDNSNPAKPDNIAFINIPGNTDIAVKNDILYANDTYGDLVALDVQDPTHAVVKKYLPQIFNNYYNTGAEVDPDSVQVVVAWQTRDTTIRVGAAYQMQYFYAMAVCPACMTLASGAPSVSAGKPATATNGSTSTFAITNNDLYALSFNSRLNVVDIASGPDPRFVGLVGLNGYTETIFPFGDKLFLGGNSGMSIYDLADPANPVLFGKFAHVTTCDPVITDGEHAFVTLRSGTACQGYTNELDILDISQLSNPYQIISYPLTNPRGLSKDGDQLFICDGKDGLKVFNAADIWHLSWQYTAGGMEANDVIAENGLAIVIATDGVYQFDYTDPQQIHQISKIDIHGSNQ